jgi:hypothetical protein
VVCHVVTAALFDDSTGASCRVGSGWAAPASPISLPTPKATPKPATPPRSPSCAPSNGGPDALPPLPPGWRRAERPDPSAATVSGSRCQQVKATSCGAKDAQAGGKQRTWCNAAASSGECDSCDWCDDASVLRGDLTVWEVAAETAAAAAAAAGPASASGMRSPAPLLGHTSCWGDSADAEEDEAALFADVLRSLACSSSTGSGSGGSSAAACGAAEPDPPAMPAAASDGCPPSAGAFEIAVDPEFAEPSALEPPSAFGSCAFGRALGGHAAGAGKRPAWAPAPPASAPTQIPLRRSCGRPSLRRSC